MRPDEFAVSLNNFINPPASMPAHGHGAPYASDPFADLVQPSMMLQPSTATRENVDAHADALASGHYAESEHEGPDNKKTFKRMHGGVEKALTVAEKAGVHGLGPLDMLMGPLSAMFGMDELNEGAQDGDAYKVMKGATELVGAASAVGEGMGPLITGITGVAAEGGALATAGPLAAAAGVGLGVGHAAVLGTDWDTKVHGYHGDMSSSEHQIAEGEKVDGDGPHTWKGGLVAVGTQFEDIGLSAMNNGIGGFGGSADAVVAQQRAMEKAQMERAFYDDMRVTEEPSMSVKGY